METILDLLVALWDDFCDSMATIFWSRPTWEENVAHSFGQFLGVLVTIVIARWLWRIRWSKVMPTTAAQRALEGQHSALLQTPQCLVSLARLLRGAYSADTLKSLASDTYTAFLYCRISASIGHSVGYIDGYLHGLRTRYQAIPWEKAKHAAAFTPVWIKVAETWYQIHESQTNTHGLTYDADGKFTLALAENVSGIVADLSAAGPVAFSSTDADLLIK